MEDLNLSVLLAQIVNFWIIFYIFYYFLWDKLGKLIEERRNSLLKLEWVEEEVRVKLENATVDAEKIINEARTKALAMEANAEKLAKQNKDKMLNAAETEAESIITWALKNIEKERLSMVNSMKSKIVDLSLKLNENLFKKETVNKDFMEKELNSING